MLKKVRDDLEGVSEEVVALYEKKADGKYHLKLEDDDAEPLRRAKEHEVGLRQIAERDLAATNAKLEEATATISALKTDAGKTANELREQLQAEWQGKLDKLGEKHKAETAALETTVKKVFVEDVALRIANDLSDIPDLLMPLLEKRLQVEIVDGKPVTRVLTDDLKASNMTPDDLKQEYSQNTKFERIIKGSNASGGGANGGNGGGGALKNLKDMNDAERKAWHERDPEGFTRASDAQKQATT